MSEEGSRNKRDRLEESTEDNAVIATSEEEPPKKLVKHNGNEDNGDAPAAEVDNPLPNGTVHGGNEEAEENPSGEDQLDPADDSNAANSFADPLAANSDAPNTETGSNPGHAENVVEAGQALETNETSPDPENPLPETNEIATTSENAETAAEIVPRDEQGDNFENAEPTDGEAQTTEKIEQVSRVNEARESQNNVEVEQSYLQEPVTTTNESVAAEPSNAETSTNEAYTLDYAPGLPVEPSVDDYSYDASAAQASSTPSTSNPESAIVEERGEVPAIFIGRVIGKGGEMIRDLQARAGCRMDVDPSAGKPGSSRIIVYRGTRKTVDFAKRLVQMLCSENVSEADLPLGEAHRKLLVIPAHTVGKIIGRGGEMIRELQSRSQARIQVDHSGTSGIDPGQKQVTITGSEGAVLKGEEMVMFLVNNPMMDALQALNMLVEDKLHRGGTWGSGPPYPNLPNQGHNMQPPGGPSAGFVGGYDQSPPNNYPPSYSPQQPGTVAAPMPNYMPNYGGPPGGPEMELFRAPRVYLGRIIGAKGVTINDLQRRSGCDIQINQDTPHGQDCEISIRGLRQGIEMVKQMIRDIIDIGPNHPYAGGADQAGYQQGGYGQGGYQQGGYGYPPQPYGYQNSMAPQPYGQPYEPPYQAPYQGYGGVYDQRAMGGYYPPSSMHQQYPATVQPPYGYDPPQHEGHPQASASASVWKSATAPDGQVYYYNERTGETQWEKPMGYP